MKKKVELTEDEKMFFIYKYLKIKDKFLKSKKSRKVFFISYLVFAAVSAIIMLFNLMVGYSALFFSTLVSMPTLYGMTCKIHDIIDEATTDRFTYRRFKEMLKSGEIDNLIVQYISSLNVPYTQSAKNNNSVTKKTNSQSIGKIKQTEEKNSLNSSNEDGKIF